MTSLSIQLDAVKFLPQEICTNRASDRTRRGEERQYLLGTFEGMDSTGTADSKKLLRCWFKSNKHMEAAWLLQEQGFGVLVVGQYTIADRDYDNKTIALSNCYIPKYDANGKFVVENEQGEEVIFTGNAGEFVTLVINAKVTLRSAPELSGTAPTKVIGLKARHATAAAQKAAAAVVATVTEPTTV